MTEYLNTLIVTVIVSQLAVRFAPSRESSKRYLRFICGIIVFLCMIEPIGAIIKNSNDVIMGIKDFSFHEEEIAENENKYIQSAEIIMKYVCDEYRIEEDNIGITLITDEDDIEVIEIHIFIKEKPSNELNVIERKMNNELSVPIYVFGG